jgi:hypothetical protein
VFFVIEGLTRTTGADV